MVPGGREEGEGRRNLLDDGEAGRSSSRCLGEGRGNAEGEEEVARPFGRAMRRSRACALGAVLRSIRDGGEDVVD